MNYLKPKKQIFLILLLAGVFLLTRFSLVSMMYHQDEYKWAMIVNPSFHLDLKSDHPPLIGILYKTTGAIFGYDHLRVLPIIVSLLCFILLFQLISQFYGRREAIFASVLYLISPYALIANTQIDIDGALLPFATLLAFYSYFNLQKGDKRNFWLPIFVFSLFFGFLIKLSFIIVVAVICTDYIIKNKVGLNYLKKIIFPAIGGILALVLVTYLFVVLFKINNPLQFVMNVTRFGILNFSERNYSQILFLSIKSLILASPFVLLSLFLVFSHKSRKDLSIWFVYILYNIIFYYFIFDFSNRTIERYNMFIIIPCAVIGGIFLAENLVTSLRKSKDVFVSTVVMIISFIVVGLSVTVQAVALPLNPKSLYLDKIQHFDFGFLIPLTGGSGPIGFYVSVFLVAVVFSICCLLLVVYFVRPNHKYGLYILVAFVTFSVSYNFVLAREFLMGGRYGNVDMVAKGVVTYTNNNPKIPQVITYYDIAGYELNSEGKYFKRFYTDPMFEKTNVSKFNSYDGYYMVVDFPEINKDSVYWKYLESCKKVFETRDKNISGYVFDCRDIIFK